MLFGPVLGFAFYLLLFAIALDLIPWRLSGWADGALAHFEHATQRRVGWYRRKSNYFTHNVYALNTTHTQTFRLYFSIRPIVIMHVWRTLNEWAEWLNNKHYFLALFMALSLSLSMCVNVRLELSCNKIAWGHVQCYKYSDFRSGFRTNWRSRRVVNLHEFRRWRFRFRSSYFCVRFAFSSRRTAEQSGRPPLKILE